MITTPLVDGYYGGLFINRKEAVRVFFTYFLVCLFPKNVFDAYTCLHVNSSKKDF